MRFLDSMAFLPTLFIALAFSPHNGFAQSDEFDGSGRYIIKVKKGDTSNPFSNKIIEDANLEYLAEELEYSDFAARELPKLGLVVTEGDDYEVDVQLDGHPLIEYYEPEREWELSSLDGVDLPSEIAVSPWLKDVLGFSTARPDPEVAIDGGSPVIVAVIDTGLTTNHPYIQSALAVNSAELNGSNGVDDDGNGYTDDVYGANVFSRSGNVTESGTDHGSHVAGIIKTIRDQAIEDYPVARRVQVLPIRFIDGSGFGTTTGAVLAMEYAAMRGARVVNASWGAIGSASFSRALYDSMVNLYNRDIVMFAAAGNASGGSVNNNDAIPYFPASFNIPALMSVGSITPVYRNNVFQKVEYSNFSNFGSSTVHVSAPGSFQESQFFDYGILSMNASYTNSFDYFLKKKGTSMATPVVAGLAGIVRAVNPALNNYDVRNLIYNNSRYHAATASKVASRGYVHAGDLLSAAVGASSSGSRPGVGLPLFFASQDSAGADGRDLAGAGAAGGDAGGGGGGGGCGMVSDVSNDQGPFGGNSILLVAGLYFLSFFMRRLFRSTPSFGHMS